MLLYEKINKLRIFPRVLIVASGIYFGYYAWYVTDWYMALSAPSTEQSAFAASVITLLGGIFKYMYDRYVGRGSDDK